MTRVVNIRKEKCDIYIGRPSKWGNPFSIGKDGSREEVIQKYEYYIRNNKKLLSEIEDLRDKTLGCYCKPLACHGDVLIKILEEKNESKSGICE